MFGTLNSGAYMMKRNGRDMEGTYGRDMEGTYGRVVEWWDKTNPGNQAHLPSSLGF